MGSIDPNTRVIIDSRLSVHEQHKLVVLAARLVRRQRRLYRIATRHGEPWIDLGGS